MGKKNKGQKRKAEASFKGSSKKNRSSSPHPPPPPLPPSLVVDYDNMPENHKYVFHLYEDCDCLRKYHDMISWLRTMGTSSGGVFKGIRNLNYSEKEYPALQIEIKTQHDTAAKFIIKKFDMYLVAFMAGNHWFQFNECGVHFPTFDTLISRGEYTDSRSTLLGPKPMIDAINKLSAFDGHVSPNLNGLVNGIMNPYVVAAQVFFIHLSEAVRFYPVESLVGRTLVPQSGNDDYEFDKVTYPDEENNILPGLMGSVNKKDDILSVVRGIRSIDYDRADPMPNYIEKMLNEFRDLSQVWYAYDIENEFKIAPKMVTSYNIRSIKSLRSTLAVLCCMNLKKKLLKGRQKTMTPEAFRIFEQKIKDIIESKRVCTPEVIM